MENSQKITGELILKAPFAESPCQCVIRHVPQPVEIEKHHLYPQSLQKKRHGKVIDHETVNLCDIAHKNVHVALTKRIKGEDFKLGNRHQQWAVEEGLRRMAASFSL